MKTLRLMRGEEGFVRYEGYEPEDVKRKGDVIDNQDIIKAELISNDITLCAECHRYNSHSRGFAEPDSRTIHYNAKGATRSTLYGFLHEVGHIIGGHGKACNLRRYEKEQQAEDYARESFRAYGLVVPRKQVALGNAYVKRWKRLGDKIKGGGN